MTSIRTAVTLPIKFRVPLFRMLRQELAQRYAGSLAGRAWYVIAPLLFLVFYALVYIYIFKVKPASMSSGTYVLYVFTGIAAFLAFADGVSASTTAFGQNRAILLNAVFPIELIPIRTAFASHVPALISFGMACVLSIALGSASVAMALLPIVFAFQLLFVAGLALVLAPIGLILKDTSELIRFATMLLLVVSPIAYLPSDLSSSIQVLVFANPLAHFIVAYQQIIVFGSAPSPAEFTTIAVVSLSVYLLGFAFLLKLKQMVGEYAG